MTIARTPQEEIEEQIQESAALIERMEANSVPYRNEIREVLPVLKELPPDALTFVASRLGITIGLPEVMEMLKALAGYGDLNFLSGVVEYESVRSRADYMGHSIRFTCLRDLATLFEVLLKRIGEKHVDPNVRQAFSTSPMAGNIVHHMHYIGNPANPATAYKDGLLWNSIQKQTDELEAIKAGFDYVKDFTTHSIADVRTYLHSTTLFQSFARELAWSEVLIGRRTRARLPTRCRSRNELWKQSSRGHSLQNRRDADWGLDNHPIPDMSDLINSQNIWASGAMMPDQMSGLFLRHSSIGLGVLVNFTHPRARKRFSYAHEYAHALLDREQTATVSLEQNRSDLSEVRANAFAAALLVPRSGVWAFLNSRSKARIIQRQ